MKLATQQWRSEMGAAWAERNPTAVEETDWSWRMRFGTSKTLALTGTLEGVVPQGLRWLDVGCASGGHAQVMREIGQICDHGCDLSEPALREFDGSAVCADARTLPYADASFDGVTTSGALMHVGQDEQVIDTVRELARIARSWILCVELWQPSPMLVSFGDLMPQAWVYPWERVIPQILGTSWSLVRCAVLRTAGRVQRVQPVSIVLMYREPPPGKDDESNPLWAERPYPWWTMR